VFRLDVRESHEYSILGLCGFGNTDDFFYKRDVSGEPLEVRLPQHRPDLRKDRDKDISFFTISHVLWICVKLINMMAEKTMIVIAEFRHFEVGDIVNLFERDKNILKEKQADYLEFDRCRGCLLLHPLEKGCPPFKKFFINFQSY
jgi:hypothetical protein